MSDNKPEIGGKPTDLSYSHVVGLKCVRGGDKTAEEGEPALGQAEFWRLVGRRIWSCCAADARVGGLKPYLPNCKAIPTLHTYANTSPV